MERTSQFQGCKQRELTREAFESIARRAQLKDRIWEDLNFKNDSCGLSHTEKKSIVNQLAKHLPALALDFDELGPWASPIVSVPKNHSVEIEERIS